jgi:hypothetical protein
MNKSEVKIKAVHEVIESIQFCDFEKGEIIFRGQVDKSWDILPSLYRIFNNKKSAGLYEASTYGHLYKNVLSHYDQSYDPVERLMVAQHFEMPTRLVDWSEDILVALFFACYDPENKSIDKDGRLHLAESRFFPKLETNSVELQRFREIPKVDEVKSYIKRFKNDDIYIIKPIIKNPRMRVQEGCFMLFPWTFNGTETPLLTLNQYIREQRKFIKKQNDINPKSHDNIFIASQIIDYRYKNSILKELDLKYGISASTLFIDSKYSYETIRYFENLKIEASNWVDKLNN